MSNKKLDLRFLSIFAPLSSHSPKLSNCANCECYSCDCDCYSKSCYCDNSSSDDEENTEIDRCDCDNKCDNG